MREIQSPALERYQGGRERTWATLDNRENTRKPRELGLKARYLLWPFYFICLLLLLCITVRSTQYRQQIACIPGRGGCWRRRRYESGAGGPFAYKPAVDFFGDFRAGDSPPSEAKQGGAVRSSGDEKVIAERQAGGALCITCQSRCLRGNRESRSLRNIA